MAISREGGPSDNQAKEYNKGITESSVTEHQYEYYWLAHGS